MPAKVVMDNLTVQVATDMLLLDQNNLPDNGTVLLASHISIDNLSVTLPDCTLSVEHHEMDNVTSGASLLRNVVGNQEMPDIQAIVSQLGAERSESRNVLYSMERSTRRLAIARMLVRDWKGSDMGQCALGSIDLADQTGASVQIAQLQMEKVHLPDARTLSRIRQMAATDNLEATLPAISELLTGETVPPVQRFSLDNMAVRVPEGDITLDQFNVLWPSVRPQDFSCEIKTLALPTSAVLTVMEQEELVARGANTLTPLFSGIDTLHASATFGVKAQDAKNSLLHEHITLNIPEWGLLDYAHLGDYATPSLGSSFRDVRLAYADNGLAARVAFLFFGKNAEKQLATLLDSFASPGTAPLIGTLKSFLSHPGNLQITSLPNKKVNESELFLIMANPAAYFDISAKPGPKSLDEQCRELTQMR